ncbi:hypothetical protein [uncultured Methanobrevibacter sp.]|uniref:hypothetical protein n=1 Tax=uncultured Methanobrevibacter sp. TaxID=253161 RepID=UPI0025D4FE67|nr:hypothetical protein [uncultured Methanobrevibacter sp.]
MSIIKNKINKIREKLYLKINNGYKPSDVQKIFEEEFYNTLDQLNKSEDSMNLVDYMTTGMLLADNLNKIIKLLEEEIKKEMPNIIKNSCFSILVEYYDDEYLRIVCDCYNNVSDDVGKLLDDWVDGWYTDYDWDGGVSFCLDLNINNINKFKGRLNN